MGGMGRCRTQIRRHKCARHAELKFLHFFPRGRDALNQPASHPWFSVFDYFDAASWAMLARNVGFRALRQCSSACIRRSSPILRQPARRFSSTGLPPVEAPAHAAHPLAGLAYQIDNVAPRFEIDPSQITILDGPAAFYDALKVSPEHLGQRTWD